MTGRTAAALLLPLLALGAGKDTAAPVPQVEVRLAASTEQPSYRADENGDPAILCTFHFDAVGEGTGTEKAEWTRMVLRYFIGPDRASPVDSLPLSVDLVVQSFGSWRIGAGESQRSSWQIRAGLPFSIEAEVYYRFGDTERSASARASCGPEPADGTAPPVLSNLALTVPDGPLEPWNRVTVSWSAMAGAGLWETGVTVVGTDVVVRFREEQGTSVQRTVELPVPPILGVPLTLEVYAVDALGRVASSVELTTPPLVDVTPPSIAMAQTQPSLAGYTPIWLRGQFGVGDTIQMLFVAQDNYRLSYLVYGAGAARDSIALDVPSFGHFIRLPIQPAWEGHADFWLHVRDASGLTSETLRGEGMRFYPVRTVSLTHAPLSVDPTGAVIDEARGQVWIQQMYRAALLAFSLPGLEPRGRVDLPAAHATIDLLPGRDTLVALVGTSLAVVDLARSNAMTVVPLAGVREAVGMRMSAAGEAVVLARLEDERIAVVAYELATGRQRVVHAGADVPGYFSGVFRSGDGRRMVLGGCVYDAIEHVLGACGDASGRGSLSGDHTGTRWANSGRVYDASLRTILEIPRIDHGNGAWMSPSGDDVFFNTVDGPLRVRISDGVYLERFGGMPPSEGITGSSDGRSIVTLGSWPSARLTHVPIP